MNWNSTFSYSFVDASNVYGSDDKTAAELRSNVDGKLKVEDGDLLPDNPNGRGLLAGDVRAHEMPGLASMHTIFVREHNRICDLIKAVRPNWDDESLYQNARRILIGEYTSIVYNGYVATVLGAQNFEGLELNAQTGSVYNSSINPSMTNEFATAADRFGHSMIQGLIKMFNTDNSGLYGNYSLGENFFNVPRYRDRMEQILMGLVTQPASNFDKEVTSEVTNLLFKKPGATFGSDLAASNIQRGRDHGLPSFCCYYVYYHDPNHDCNNGWGTKFNGISDQNWSLLQSIYNHPNDIDLFTGGLAQEPYRGGLIGKVFTKIFRKFTLNSCCFPF